MKAVVHRSQSTTFSRRGISQSLNMLQVIKDGSAARYIATIVSKNDTPKGYVLMTGERGLLIYFPDGDRFSFQKADAPSQVARRTTGSGRHAPGLTTRVTHRNGLFRLGVILGRIAHYAETRRVEIGGFRTLAEGLGGFPRLGHA